MLGSQHLVVALKHNANLQTPSDRIKFRVDVINYAFVSMTRFSLEFKLYFLADFDISRLPFQKSQQQSILCLAPQSTSCV